MEVHWNIRPSPESLDSKKIRGLKRMKKKGIRVHRDMDKVVMSVKFPICGNVPGGNPKGNRERKSTSESEALLLLWSCDW